MKKRMFTLALAMSLIMGCMAMPAFASGERSEEMTKVTLAVKGQLDIGDEYDKFSGDCTDLGVLRYWQLNWSKEDGSSLNVTADSSGKILSYDCYTPEKETTVSSWDSGGFNPTFPAVNAAQVEAAAQAFLDKVLSAPESAKLEPVTLRLSGYRKAVSVSGTILLNGTDSPLSFSMRLSLPDLTVTSYNRRDAWGMIVIGDVPSEKAAVTQSAASAKLNSVLDMELRYVDADDGTIALRYVPTTQGNWYVDAQTGELVDLSKLPGGSHPFVGEAGGGNKNESMDAAAPEAAPSLSPVEQESVDQMAGTLSAEELDGILKKIAPLGLAKMTQAGASYYMSGNMGVRPTAAGQEEKQIVCRLTYTRDLTKAETDPKSADDPDAKPVLRKYITVDAVTGALLRVSSSSEYAKEDAFTGDAAAAVKEFLAAQYPEYFAACARKNEDTDQGNYIRQVNGVPYYSNYLNASVCMVDGTIGYFSMDWDENASFPAPENIVDAAAALNAYAGCFEAALAYTPYPEKVDTNDPQWLTYSQHLGDVKYRWVLSYVLCGDTPQGVDAFTGKALAWPARSANALTYTDCENCYGREEIEALAAYGVGFSRGGKFRPTEKVTQRDMLVLLLSALGCTYDADEMDEETENTLYETAYAQGLLTKAQRDPGKAVTRMDFLKAMLTSSAYGKAAQLQGIYKTSFSDAASIPAADLGYAAMGQALGIVSGDQAKALNPNAVLTRQDAAIMLCRFMEH